MVTMAAVGNKVREARQAAALSQAEVADRMGIDRTSLSRIESGERSISATEIAGLSQVLGRSISFFLGDAEPSRDMLLRAENVRPVDHATLGAFLDHCADYASLEQLLYGEVTFGLPSYITRPGRRAIDQGEELAREERRRLGLGDAPVHDIYGVIEEQGVKIYASPAPDSELMGAFYVSPDLGPCIYINLGVAGGRANFTAAHEYCHFLVDRELIGGYACVLPDRSGSKPPHEIRANSFAASFLMPREGVQLLIERYGVDGPEDVVYLQRHFGASYEAVLWRLLDLRLISEVKRQHLLTTKRAVISRAFGEADGLDCSGERDALAGGQGRRFRQLAMEAFRKGKISGGKFAELLQLSRDEARQLIAELTEQPIVVSRH